MTQTDTTTGGNTKLTGRSRKWVFTLNNPTQNDIDTINTIFSKEKYVYQKERGEQGTEHLQGYIELTNARTFASMKKSLPTAHIEICKNSKASILYCQKEETRIEGPWGPLVIKTIKDPLKGINLKDWQKEIIDLIKTEPDDRSIYWYWDEEGGKGKTSLAKSLCINNPDEILYTGGKANDIKYAVKSFIDSGKTLKVCIFDFTRSVENFISYEAIEAIKNGIFFNNKYESGMCIFNPPHIIIFSNFEPDTEKLSSDRWNLRTI